MCQDRQAEGRFLGTPRKRPCRSWYTLEALREARVNIWPIVHNRIESNRRGFFKRMLARRASAARIYALAVVSEGKANHVDHATHSLVVVVELMKVSKIVGSPSVGPAGQSSTGSSTRTDCRGRELAL